MARERIRINRNIDGLRTRFPRNKAHAEIPS